MKPLRSNPREVNLAHLINDLLANLLGLALDWDLSVGQVFHQVLSQALTFALVLSRAETAPLLAALALVLVLDLVDDFDVAWLGLLGTAAGINLELLTSDVRGADKESESRADRARSAAIGGALRLHDLADVLVALQAADKLIDKGLR